jgi:peptidoglycan/LPS O-acetylase OafA/YrhL
VILNRANASTSILPHHIPEVDGLRALAILGVVYVHLTWNSLGPLAPNSPIATWWLPLRLVFEGGWLGVNLLFFLSGLVLYLPYARGERSMSGWPDAWTFIRRRLRRLMPLYYIVGILALALGPLKPFDPAKSRSWIDLATFLTVTFNFSPATFVPRYLYPLWSLGVEIWFSLLFPLLLPLYLRHRAPLVATAVLVTLGARWWAEIPQSSIALNWIGDSLPARLPDFLFGMLAADLALARSRLLNPVSFLLFGVGGVFAGLAVWHFWFLKALPAEAAIIPTLLLDLGFLFGVGFLLTHRTPLNALLRLWPVRIIGAMCYSVYLWHVPLLERLVLLPFYSFAEKLQALPIFIAFLLVLSALSYRFIEFGHRPAREIFLLQPRAARAVVKRPPTQSAPCGQEPPTDSHAPG